MNKEERMETTPQNTKGPDAHTTADRAASAKKTREEAARNSRLPSRRPPKPPTLAPGPDR
jgi:hypothetical protein